MQFKTQHFQLKIFKILLKKIYKIEYLYFISIFNFNHKINQINWLKNIQNYLSRVHIINFKHKNIKFMDLISTETYF